MLLNLREYHRPAGDLERVVELLARREIRTVVLAGGDTLIGAADQTIEAVVDLQDAGLDKITGEPGTDIEIGAMATRAALAENKLAGRVYGGILAAAAHHWGGNVQRNRATVGGAVAAAAANDPLLVALLACNADVVLYTQDGLRTLSLDDFLPRRTQLLTGPVLITALVIKPETGVSSAALAQVGRTPHDAPIVVAAAYISMREGRCSAVRLALGGVRDAPVRMKEVEAALMGQTLSEAVIEAATAGVAALVQPAGDFRGSVEYRRAMAAVLGRRVLNEAWNHAR